MATATLTNTTLPDAKAIAAAVASNRQLAAFLSTKLDTQRVELIGEDNQRATVELPTFALRLLSEILAELAQGNTVKVVPIHAELTTQEAADLLNVSRPYLIKLLDEEAIPYSRTGKHRRIRFSDLMDYKEKRERESLAAMEALAAQAQDLGMGY